MFLNRGNYNKKAAPKSYYFSPELHYSCKVTIHSQFIDSKFFVFIVSVINIPDSALLPDWYLFHP